MFYTQITHIYYLLWFKVFNVQFILIGQNHMIVKYIYITGLDKKQNTLNNT